MAQLVGDAYVRIYADSRAMANAIRREAKRAGKEGGDEFVKDFDAQIRDYADHRLKDRNADIVKGIVGGKDEWDRQLKQSGKSIDEFTADVQKRLEKIAKNSDKFKGLNTALKDLSDWQISAKSEESMRTMNDALKQQAKNSESSKKAFDRQAAALRKLADDDDAFRISVEKAHTAALKLNKAMDQKVVTDRWKALERLADRQNKLNIAVDKAHSIALKMNHDLDAKRVLAQAKAYETYGENIKTALERRGLPATQRFARAIRRARFDTEKFADTIGKAFGKGSRSNAFFHFTGSVAKGIAQISASTATGGIKLLGGMLEVAETAGRGFVGILGGIGQLMSGGGSGGISQSLKTLTDDFSSLSKEMGPLLANAAKSGAAALVALLAALVGISVAVPVVLSLIGSLVGIIVALAGTISIALAGAALALVPVLLALAGGVGLVVLYFTQMKNASDDAKKALKPLSDEWRKFMKFLQDKPMKTLNTAFAELAPLIKELKPFVTGFSDAIAAAALRFATLFTAADMKPFIRAFQTTLPQIMHDVGIGIADLLSAVVKFFKPILPYAQMLGHNFERLMSQFNDWVGSAKGQNAIADFMKTAWDRATDVWNILVLIGQAIGGLFSAGDAAAGGSFIDSIRKKLEDFVAWIGSPDGQKGLADFFTNAKDLATRLWGAISDITTALRSIDWDGAAANANAAITFIGKLIAGITFVISAVNAIIKGWGVTWQAVSDVFITIYNNTFGPLLDKILGGFSAIVEVIAGMLDALSNVPHFEWAKDAADKMHAAADGADRLGDSVRHIPTSHEIELQITGQISAVARQILNVASSFGGRKGPGGTIRIGQRLLARGSIVSGATSAIIGEAGPEAVVPLNRPLSQVDPSVRALSAFAQGKNPRMAGGGIAGGRQVVIEAGAIVVNTVATNPRNVAEAVMDRIAARMA